jgi:hypothetical protein
MQPLLRLRIIPGMATPGRMHLKKESAGQGGNCPEVPDTSQTRPLAGSDLRSDRKSPGRPHGQVGVACQSQNLTEFGFN